MATGQAQSLGDRLVQPVTNVSDFIWAGLWNGEAVIPFPPLAIILLGVGLWFMAGLRFYPITKLGAAAKGLFAGRKGEGAGEISPFAALSTALSGQVGTGNLAGVATAIALGGPGAIFWMWITALFGMALAFAEGSLAIRYRETTSDGVKRGGPMTYIMMGLGPKWTWLAVLFCLGTLFSALVTGNSIQANAVADGLNELFGIEEWLGGLIVAILVFIVIIGGIKSIGQVTGKLVPAMALTYVVACLVVIAANIGQVPNAFGEIITGAFSPEGVTGGVVGVLIIGFQRAAFSNEAGVGSAPIAHSAVKTSRPASEGFVALLEPFIDTVIICTMTALVIVIAEPQSWLDGKAAVAAGETPNPDGVVLTSDAFETVVPWFPYLLALAVALFAYSTLLTWAYYTQKAFTTLFGRTPASERTFQIIFCLFTVFGAVVTLQDVIVLADSMLFVCALVNIFGLYLLLPVVRREVAEYWADKKADRLERMDA